jgi:hypothetical protein
MLECDGVGEDGAESIWSAESCDMGQQYEAALGATVDLR